METTEQKQEKKQEENADQKRKSKYIAIVLYPDNPYHMNYLHYLEDTQEGFYIIHDFGDDLAEIPLDGVYLKDSEKIRNEKKHIHCILSFKNPRSGSGFLKSLPTMKYYQYEEQSKLFTVYDIPYISIPDKKANTCIVEVNKPLLSTCKPVVDIYAYSQYILHRDFKSFALGKKQYNIQDIRMLNCDRTFLDKFYAVDELNDSQILDIVNQIWTSSNCNKKTFIQLLSMYSNQKVLKYVQSHAYFINKFIVENSEVKIYD